MEMQLILLLQIFSVVYGQASIPAGIRLQCFDSPNCGGNTVFDQTTTGDTSSCCLTESSAMSFRLDSGECRSCDHTSVTLPDGANYECYNNVDQCSAGSFPTRGGVFGGSVPNTFCCGSSATLSGHFTLSGGDCIACYSLTSSEMGNDPHFLLPLPNGDQLCFSIQGQPNFAFSLISDKYIQLNGQFVLPAEEESHTISNVSTFLGDLGLVVRNPVSGNVTTIKVSAQDHSVTVGNSLTIIKDRPVMVEISNKVKITVDAKIEDSLLKDASSWLFINADGFSIKVKFYKKHLNMFVTKASSLTKEADGIIGQILTTNIIVDEDAHFIKLNDGDPIPARKEPIWPFMGIPGDCWYGTTTDNQGRGVIKGDYTDYIVEHLVAPNIN